MPGRRHPLSVHPESAVLCQHGRWVTEDVRPKDGARLAAPRVPGEKDTEAGGGFPSGAWGEGCCPGWVGTGAGRGQLGIQAPVASGGHCGNSGLALGPAGEVGGSAACVVTHGEGTCCSLFPHRVPGRTLCGGGWEEAGSPSAVHCERGPGARGARCSLLWGLDSALLDRLSVGVGGGLSRNSPDLLDS